MKRVIIDNIEFYRFENIFNDSHELDHYITTRQSHKIIGEDNSSSTYNHFNMCDYTGDDIQKVKYCRTLFSNIANIPVEELWFPRQVHGTDILIVDDIEEARRNIKENTYDAIITNQKSICIGVSTADCVPILIYDKTNKIIAAVHAGWRGTVGRIASKTIEVMKSRFGSMPHDLYVGIGPSVSLANFEVGDEVVDSFRHAGFEEHLFEKNKDSGKFHIDLWQANADDIISSGVNIQNIEISGLCTIDNSALFFSARKLGIKSGRITTCIILK